MEVLNLSLPRLGSVFYPNKQAKKATTLQRSSFRRLGVFITKKRIFAARQMKLRTKQPPRQCLGDYPRPTMLKIFLARIMCDVVSKTYYAKINYPHRTQ